MKRESLLLAATGVLALAAGLFAAQWLKPPQSHQAPATASALVGEPAPPFTLGAADGARVSLSDFRGQVLLVNFWATWCAPCREEMPMLDALHDELAERGFAVVGIAMDDVQRAREFAGALDIGYPVLVGAGDVFAVMRAYGNAGGMLPYSVLVDRDGRVQWVELGELQEAQLRRRVSALLEGLRPRPDR